MSRETDFTQAFTIQFRDATLFNITHATKHEELAPSDFPAFSLQLGRTYYHGLDNEGYLHLGSQDFTLRMFFKSSQLALDNALSSRGTYITFVESFISSGFIPPTFTGAEMYRITSTEITEVLPPEYDELLTNHVITIRGRYNYVFV